jgi:hypothetical protein
MVRLRAHTSDHTLHALSTRLVHSSLAPLTHGSRTALARLVHGLCMDCVRQVRIVIYVDYENAADANAGLATLNSQTATPALASTFVSTSNNAVTVESIASTPTVAQMPSPPSQPPPSPSPPPTPPPPSETPAASSGGGSSGLGGGAIAAIVVGVCSHGSHITCLNISAEHPEHPQNFPIHLQRPPPTAHTLSSDTIHSSPRHSLFLPTVLHCVCAAGIVFIIFIIIVVSRRKGGQAVLKQVELQQDQTSSSNVQTHKMDITAL